MWPGFGDNLRVLEWILGRCAGQAEAVETPVGLLPPTDALALDGLAARPDMETLLAFEADGWRRELTELAEFLQDFEPRVPEGLHRELARVSAALG